MRWGEFLDSIIASEGLDSRRYDSAIRSAANKIMHTRHDLPDLGCLALEQLIKARLLSNFGEVDPHWRSHRKAPTQP